MTSMVGVDYALVRRVRDSIGKHSLLDPESSWNLAEKVVKDLDLKTETHQIQGAEYLGGVSICRWVTGYFKR